MIKVLFICSGNICRSPMADAVFKDMVKKAGLADEFMVDSAGTGSWHVGESAHSGTRRMLQKHNITYNGRARQMTQNDLNNFDYVLAMDHSHLRHIEYMQRNNDRINAEINMFLRYANDAGLTSVQEVPDPYYNNRFEEVYDLVDKGCRALLQHIRQAHHL